MTIRLTMLATVIGMALVLLGACGPPINTEHGFMFDAEYETAVELMRDGKYSEAITNYQMSISEHESPELNALAQYNIGKCYTKMKGKDKEAMDAFQKVVDQYPTSFVVERASNEIKHIKKRQSLRE